MKLCKISECDFDETIKTQGWIRNHRKQKERGFIDIFDGSMFETVQLVYERDCDKFDFIQTLKPGSSIKIQGKKIKSPKNKYDILIEELELIGDVADDYPIQPKSHSREFLRSQAHLRSRTNLFRAVFKIRSVTSMAIHTFFQEEGFLYVHTPLITCSDCEGENQMFKITALDFDNLPYKEGKVDFEQDLFSKQSFITGTGQLHAEAFALAFGDVYTFGPTFRTEKSNTKVHANEFWMVEPEMAFCDLKQLMDIEEKAIKSIIKIVLEKCESELKFLDQFVENGLIEKLEKVINIPSVRVTYTKVIEILKNADKKWEFEPVLGEDIAKEHERYLAEEYFKGPLFITDWPKDIKPFYCKLNEDGKTVAAVDYILPKCGEVSSGSQREDDYLLLQTRIEEMEIDESTIDWYKDLRKYGSVPHSGFGFGLERLLIYFTGLDNIRDVIPFPRTPGNCKY